MPRMPTDETIGLPQIASRSIRRGVTDPRGEALQSMGSAIQRLGSRAAALVGQHEQERDTLDLARARADWNTRRLNEDDQYRIENDPSYDKWEKKYSAAMEKHANASSSLISNPKVRERFDIETMDDIARGTSNVRGRALTIDTDKRRAQGFDSIEQNLMAAAKPNASSDDIEKIFNQTRANIDNMVGAGLLSPEQAITARRKYVQRFASIRVRQDIENDPKQASGYINGSGGGATGIIQHFEGYRSKPYWDVNGYRVGYGSDTITRADGSVIKVRPGMVITREDADRDLNRRIGEFQAKIVQEVGPEHWAGLPANAKAALISVAYNYGNMPDQVTAAIKSGDLNAIAGAVEGLGGHNSGINAKRRAKEAAIIRSGGTDMGEVTPPPYYEYLQPEDRMQLASAAEGEWASRENQARDANALQEYQVSTQLDDDVAQIETTGKGIDLQPEQVQATLGDVKTAKWLEQRETAAATYAAVSSMESMTNDQIEEHLGALMPEAGDAHFARTQGIYEKAEKRANELQKLRMDDPAKSVNDSPVVVQAIQSYTPGDPQSTQGLVRARLAAQGSVKIPESMRQPVTRAEAKELIAPIERILDLQDASIVAAAGQAKDSASRRIAAKEIRQQAENQIRATVQQIEDTYGPFAPKVLAFAIAESVRDKEIGDLASGVWRKIARGETPTRAEVQGLDNANDASIAEKAVSGQLPSPENNVKQATQPERDQNLGAGRGRRTEPSQTNIGRGTVRHNDRPGPFAPVTQKAVDALMSNPNLAPEFDKLFGPGEAAKWLPKPFPETP